MTEPSGPPAKAEPPEGNPSEVSQPEGNLSDAVLRILDRRGIRITDEHRARIRSRTNLELLDMWLVATVVDQLADDDQRGGSTGASHARE